MNIAEAKLTIKTGRDMLKTLLDNLVTLPEDEEDDDDDDTVYLSHKKKDIVPEKKTRANSFAELKSRLPKQEKKVISFKEKLEKKALKRKQKREKLKKLKKENPIVKSTKQKVKVEADESNTAPSTSSETTGGVLYSKINFPVEDKKQVNKDPQKQLMKLKKQKEVLEKVRQSGNIKKAVEVQHKTAFKNALLKASGEKVKDDPELLKKSIKRREQKKKHSKKKWDERKQKVDNLKQKKQEKRQMNLEKRSKTKKVNKLKKASKKGRIIPGF